MKHKRKPQKKTYALTNVGIEHFEIETFSEIMKALDNETIEKYGDIQIKIGENYISIPLYAETYENTIEFLKNTLEELEEEEKC